MYSFVTLISETVELGDVSTEEVTKGGCAEVVDEKVDKGGPVV